MKKQIFILTIGLFFFCSSCNDFLDEKLTTRQDMSIYKTEEGILSLATSNYYKSFNVYNSEWPYCHMNYGTDEFHLGASSNNASFNNYDTGLNSIVPYVDGYTMKAEQFWDAMYSAIGTSNLLIRSIKDINSQNPSINKTALGEGYFFRAYNYLRLVRQYGGVPLILEPMDVVEREFARASSEEVLNQIILDFKEAYKLLPESSDLVGKVTKYAAAHFLAKAYLTRASEINESWNTKTKESDLNETIKLCDEVIDKHPLANDFSDLWDYRSPDGNNEKLDEIILSAQFTSNEAYTGYNKMHLFFLSRYDDLAYMQRDLTGGRPFSRLGTTYYMYRVYDLVNDSRFWKSFKTKSRLNNAIGDYYENGDLGIMYIINKPGDNRFSKMTLNDEVVYSKTNKTIPHVYVAYPAGVNEDGALYSDVRFPSLSKYLDASRGAVNNEGGYRDFIVARSADTYLFAAEAKIRLGDYKGALTYINKVRSRAAYKEGEDRSYYTDGGAAFASSLFKQDENINSFMPENSYYESNNIPITVSKTDLIVDDIHNLPMEDEYIISKLGYTSDYDRMLCFLLNERSRELCGEMHRWEDLARTKTLIKRAREFNPEAAPNIQEFHLYRPIPQTFLDGVRKDGRSLTPEEKKQLQNPGY